MGNFILGLIFGFILWGRKRTALADSTRCHCYYDSPSPGFQCRDCGEVA